MKDDVLNFHALMVFGFIYPARQSIFLLAGPCFPKDREVCQRVLYMFKLPPYGRKPLKKMLTHVFFDIKSQKETS